MERRTIIAVAVTAVALIPTVWGVVGDLADENVLTAKFAAEQRDTLRGMKGVKVVVEELAPGGERYGLTREAFQTDTELLLRQYGIKVLSPEEQVRTPGLPWLYVGVSHAGIDADVSHVAVIMTVQLQQLAFLARDPNMMSTATTWHTAQVVNVGRSNLRRIRDTTKDLVAEFINDYLAVNPRDGEGRGAGRDGTSEEE